MFLRVPLARFWHIKCTESVRRIIALVFGALFCVASLETGGWIAIPGLLLGVGLVLRAVLPPALIVKMAAFDAIAAINTIDEKDNVSERDLMLLQILSTKLVLLGKRAVPQVVNQLRYPNSTTPGAPYAAVLGRLGDKAVQGLIDGMMGIDPELVCNSIIVLGRIATPEAVAALKLSPVRYQKEAAIALGEAELHKRQRRG